MRIGQNPAKAGLKAWQPHLLGVVIISYIPNQSGFFEESLQIIQVEIASLRKHTSEDFDLYLFDNGSCPEVQEELLKLNQGGAIDFLTLSQHNIGKIGALNWAIASMTNEWIMYSDSDFFFRKNWLEESMKLAEEFPTAAMITAQPNIFDQLEGKSKVLSELNSNEFSLNSQKLDQAVIENYCRGIGASKEMQEKYLAMDSLIVHRKINGAQAVFGACTAQFLGKREYLEQVFPLHYEFVISREEDNEICRKVDSMRWLQVSTFKPYVIHMGNHLDETILQEIQDSKLNVLLDDLKNQIINHKSNLAWKFLVKLNGIGFLRQIFKRLYINLFELYSIEKK